VEHEPHLRLPNLPEGQDGSGRHSVVPVRAYGETGFLHPDAGLVVLQSRRLSVIQRPENPLLERGRRRSLRVVFGASAAAREALGGGAKFS